MPGRQIHDEAARVISVEKIEIGFLSKDELIALYHETGGLLHRGTLRNYKPRTSRDFDKILHTTTRIVTLLNHHQIQLSDPDYQLWVILKTAKDDKVHAWILQKTA
ncbi:hypothetical protein ACVIW2_001224 [Bradyrhizobium huanghuaihaiense]|uniref:hypothetical protein n=1 Tax=Bradyrhizobium huanghuaihaiense TaxID=990078 RepID=UPI0003678988|nr:hypothetical protein [Bradyrhizobium huanghuaihaiense]